MDYDLIHRLVEPKLAYHGFKYDETRSYPPQGHYIFTRSYWCTSQWVSICRVEYNLEDTKAVVAEGLDFPSEVPQSVLLNHDSGFRLWLSNRYITAVLQTEHRSMELWPGQGIIQTVDVALGCEQPKAQSDLSHVFQPGIRLPTWWEFEGEGHLQVVLQKIVDVVVTGGLDWFEEQIASTRRYHEKLDKRRLEIKKKNQNRQK